MAFSYRTFDDFIRGSFVGKNIADALKNSYRFIGEDILGDPSINSSRISLPASLTIGGELKGSRQFLLFGSTNITGGSDAYIGINAGSNPEFGYLVNHGGSVVGLSVFGVTFAFTSNLSHIFRIRKNAIDLVSSSTVTWTANDQIQTYSATFTRGTYTFSASDKLSMFLDYQSGTATIRLSVLAEVQFNT